MRAGAQSVEGLLFLWGLKSLDRKLDCPHVRLNDLMVTLGGMGSRRKREQTFF